MCGIAGIIAPGADEDTLRKSVSCLKHRGPQQENIWKNDGGNVVLGHSRLSIIDLSTGGAQPMHCIQRYTIIHNGELYNYLELRKELEAKQYQFFSQSDTEVIALSFHEWGKDCLQKFDGMFAFAIWDEKEQKLFAARDRFGEKPFYFFYDGRQFIFASEMKALWTAGVNKEVNRSMLYNFLTIGYASNPSDPGETFYNNIHKLPAASFLLYSLHDNKPVIEKYWQLYPELNNHITEGDAVHKFQRLFTDSLKKRMRSDVAIGTSLSGGLDSSSIIAFSQGITSEHYSHKCFTASFPGFEKDETAMAAAVASQYHLQHHVTETSADEIVELMQTVMDHQEEPFTSASVLVQYKVYALAKKNGVTVLLDGQGADEVLAGYTKYYRWYWQELYREKKLKKSGEIAQARALGITESFSSKNKLAALLPEFAGGIAQGRKSRSASQNGDLNPAFAFENKRNLYYTLPSSFTLNGALYFDTFVHGLEELLRLADRNSMAHATEIRLPFLNHNLVQFLFSLPPQLKIHNGWTKYLLRKSVEERLPAAITWRKDKTGFEPPQEQWMNNKEVQAAIRKGKEKLVREGILHPDSVKKIKPHSAYAASNQDWKYWSASFMFP